MQHHRLRDIAQQPAVKRQVVVGATGTARERTAGHQDHPSALRFDNADLLTVGGFDLRQGHVGPGGQLIGPRTAGEVGAGHGARMAQAALDQFARDRPLHPHAPLSRVHRLGDLEAERPEVFAKGQRAVPVDDG